MKNKPGQGRLPILYIMLEKEKIKKAVTQERQRLDQAKRMLEKDLK